MKVRAIESRDLDELKRIHYKFYDDNSNFPDFLKHYLCAFVIEDNDEKIISAGGLRTIVEAIAITDKDLSARVRMEALYKMMDINAYFAGRNGYEFLHAFTQDDNWKNHLVKHGFEEKESSCLVGKL